MREYTSPRAVEVDPGDNTVSALLRREAKEPDAPAVAVRRGDRFADVTVAEFTQRVRRLAAGLIALGLEPGSTVALFCSTRIEFSELDYAIWAARGATVTIYETSSAEQVEWIVGNSRSVGIFVENAELEQRFKEVADGLPDCRHTFVIDQGGLDELIELGADVTDEQVDECIAGITHDDLATLVYTSGTTGRPKGCVLTHRNFIWTVHQIVGAVPELFKPGSSTLLFLPLAHILARAVQVACISNGIRLGYSTGIKRLVEELRLFKPTFLVGVPRVFEKVYSNAAQQAGEGARRRLFDRAADIAVQYSKAVQNGEQPSRRLAFAYRLYDRLVYSRLRDGLGGKARYAVSGGAALDEWLGHFFTGAGVMVLEGYGLTESTASGAINSASAQRVGTVGRPVPSATVRIADDGELLLKGPHVFQGYWENEEATAEALDGGGWLHTGDIGELDGDGFLRITGRQKDLIVTAGGKNVAPAVLEHRLQAHTLISRAVVIGDGKPFVAALVTVDPEELPRWAARRDKQCTDPTTLLSELADDPDLIAEVQQAVNDANKAVSRAESIRTFRILPGSFSIDTGELTPTLKVKRNVVTARHTDLIDDIYAPRG